MRKIIAMVILVNLAGCASYESRFDCTAPDGVGCRSVSEINEMINRKEIGSAQADKVEALSSNLEKVVYVAKPDSDDAPSRRIIRLPERTMSIWVKGFTDDKGDYVEDTKVHTVIEAGGWQEIE